MQQGKNIPNQTPMPIQCEDKNMFRKLYCPGTSCEQCGGSTTCTHLSVNFQESAFDAEIFPNPSTGSTMLRFSLKKSSSVQVIIVDMLGRTIATADEREQNVGENWLRLPTSQLPSGQYVCRIKAADGEESINFIIQK
jgi:hypothetical protein